MQSTVLSSSYRASTAEVVLSSPANGQVGRVQEKLALVIPTLCEADNIGGLLRHVRSVLDPLGVAYEILVVDDDSDDGTGDLVSWWPFAQGPANFVTGSPAQLDMGFRGRVGCPPLL